MPSQDPKLTQITTDGNLRAKIQTILYHLAARGYADAFIAEAMRTREEQAEKVRKGYSKTMKSYHLLRGSDGKGLAADIVPRSTGWNAPKRYWMMLGWVCHEHGVGWGGVFSLTTAKQQALLESMQRLSEKGWPEGPDPDYQTPIGWDPAHCQKANNWKV
jgi:uncharacterized protein YoaH (UPF0181 family)